MNLMFVPLLNRNKGAAPGQKKKVFATPLFTEVATLLYIGRNVSMIFVIVSGIWMAIALGLLNVLPVQNPLGAF